jgi:hypothetical protein
MIFFALCCFWNMFQTARAEHVFERVTTELLTGGHITYDPQAAGYVFMPLEYAPSPHSLGRRLFDRATIQLHLEALAQKQQVDGG